MTLNDYRDECYEAARAKGFHDDPAPANPTAYRERIGNRLMLVVSELVEAHDEIRKGKPPTLTYFKPAPADPNKPEGVPSEIVDALIRLFDLAGELGIDLDEIYALKRAYNDSRPYKHGKKF